VFVEERCPEWKGVSVSFIKKNMSSLLEKISIS